MSVSGNSIRSHHRRSNVSNGSAISTAPAPKVSRNRSRTVSLLLSCTVFFAVLCACLIAALVLVGKHVISNSSEYSRVHSNSANNNNNNDNKYTDDNYVVDVTVHKERNNESVIEPTANISTKSTIINRLPNDVYPILYDITLRPNLTTGLFTGRVNITVNVTVPRDTILLHSKDLNIDSVAVLAASGNTESFVPVVSGYDLRSRDELLEISLTGDGNNMTEAVLPVGRYYLVIEFGGSLLNRTTAFYHSTYKTKQGEKRSIATSKFEPTYARQAYPCFDEPNMKAKFIVHLFKPLDKEYISLSNMPIKDSETQTNGVMVNFEESVPMSTYLSCFIVSDFKYKTATFGENVELRVYSSLEQLSKTDYALDVGVKAMNFYEGYFGINYPLPKLDMVAIPDFVSGAMEHWGLVTYRETALLYSEEISSSANKQRVATVVAHELAHSWFGNLVTMDWWNDLWLNEGFASYIEYKGVHAAEPTWQMMNQFLIDDLHPVMILDATLGSHAIVKNVLTPNEITEIFDTISYNKGAAVLRMLEGAVTDTVFQAGVKAYLIKFSLGNAVTQDFWDEMNKVTPTDLDVTAMMDTWTKQMGYPVLSVKKEGNKYTLTQSRFLTNSKATGEIVPSDFDYKWTIPVNYISDIDATPKQAWFDWKADNLELTIDGAWVKFNPEQVGYYRVNYSPTEWELMATNIKGMSVADRSHLLEESFRIAESGLIAYSVPLDLSKYLVEEKEYIPWTVASTMFSQFNKLLFSSPSYDLFKKHVLKLVDPIYNELGWTEVSTEGHLEKRTRVAVLSLACSMGNTHCIAEANKQFKDWLQNPKELSQDLRSIIYTYGMESATQDEWEQVLDKFVKEIDANEKTKLMSGLTHVNSPSLLQRLIRFAEDPQNIRNQDYFSCIQAIAANPSGTALVWDYVRENWDELVKRFGINERYLGRMIPSITSRFTTDVKYDEITAFFAKHVEAGAGAAARIQALEAVKNNIRWVETYEESITTWLNANV